MRLRIHLICLSFALPAGGLAAPGFALEFDLSAACLQLPVLCNPLAPPQVPPPPEAEPAVAEPQPPPPEPDAPPSVSLSSEDNTVRLEEDVVLKWRAEDAQECEASGGWGGAKPTSGRETIGPIASNTSYTLTCSGEGGSAISMVRVRVFGEIALRWQPPTHNVDGSALTDLAGYKIYWGDTPGDYHRELAVDDSAATQHTLVVPVGTYHLVMTAFNLQGRESAPSAEVRRTTQ